jgi:hypothetical protein
MRWRQEQLSSVKRLLQMLSMELPLDELHKLTCLLGLQLVALPEQI